MPQAIRCPPKLCVGVGAECSILYTKLHLKKVLAAHITNLPNNQRICGLIVTRDGTATRSGKTFPAIFFVYHSMEGEELYAARRFVVVTREGEPSLFFADPVAKLPPEEVAEINQNLPDEEARILNESIFKAQNLKEDIAFACAQGLYVDNDNKPAPENVPVVKDAVVAAA